tara:strand:- start:1421 stop:1885 length:465 start_codon:yes stop_codon:yes gene_type:complete
MKKIKFTGTLIIAVIIGSVIYAFGLNIETPQRVKEAFSMKFPTVKKVKWEKESVTEWEAEFKIKSIEYSASFLEDGTWKETEHEIKKSDIPESINYMLNSEFKGYKIEEAEISETINGSVYEFELEKGGEELEVVFDLNGKLVKKELLKEEDID